MRRFALLACAQAAWLGFGNAAEPRPLVDAIADLNSKAAKEAIGNVQPPLTEAEVVGAIRGWVRRARPPAADETYLAFQNVATTGLLPDGARLDYTTSWRYNGYDFNVWWVDLTLMTGEKTFYTFRIRERIIASRPIER
jgi:hypothetical protein